MLFDQFLFVGSKRSPIAASKIIHVLKPELLLMWDGAIKTGYGCGYNKPLKGKTWSDTYFIFLLRVQKKVRNMLSLYSKQLGLGGIMQASSHLQNRLYRNSSKTLVKIIDEYNFQKFTNGSNNLW